MDKKSDDKIETKSQIQIFLRNNFVFLFLLVPIIIFALRSRSCANNYPFIPKEFFHFELVKKTTGNLEFPLETPSCSYKELIEENRFAYMESNLRSILNETNIQFGGEFIPHNCIPHFSTAIIIPYRNRETQLNAFIPYIHNFLRQQQIHYRIFIVEQADDKPFNRAKLFNIGYTYANELNFPCLVLHDVDLMPMNVGNLYACTQKPRHMSANVDKFRFYLPFTELFGGAVAIQVEHFQAINGVSNLYEGWGREDDDFLDRLKAKNIIPYRMPPEFNLYTMLIHKQEAINEKSDNLYDQRFERLEADGLSSLNFTERALILNKFYTHILVET